MLRRIHALFLAFLFILGAPTALAQPVVVTYFHNDISGSPMLATDAAGNQVWKESYRPYGDKLRNVVPSRNDTNKIGYAGSPFDASTGLSYMGARYYDPVIGRFMGIDPVGFQEDNVHSFNRYAYANNNPYRYIDRDGRQSTDILYNVWNRAFSNSAGPNANGAMGLEVAKQGIVQGYVDGLKLSAEVGLTVGSPGLGAVEATATTRVGRWMSQVELSAMKQTGMVQEGGGGITRVAVPAKSSAYKNAPKGDKYVEFDVPTSRLSPHSEGTGKIAGPNSPEARVPGRDPANYKMPTASNIVN